MSLNNNIKKTRLDADSVRRAYKRQATFYDYAGFGLVSRKARNIAVERVNSLPGLSVIEVGVGTGLALPLYSSDKLITGIDLSEDMLAIARERIHDLQLNNIAELAVMDAEQMDFETNSFDIAVAMFVASVAPNPKILLQELKRVVRPGGTILFINHFLSKRKVMRFLEKASVPASRYIGWHPDFVIEDLLEDEDIGKAEISSAPPLGMFQLVELQV